LRCIWPATSSVESNLVLDIWDLNEFAVGTWEIKCEIKKNDYFNHMDGAIFDEPGCMGSRRGCV